MNASWAWLLGIGLMANAPAASFTVDTTSASSLTGCTAAAADCSLAGAIARANANGGADLVEFSIPAGEPGCSAGTCRITLSSALPQVSGPLTIDGYTQPGAQANTLAPDQGGSNAQIRIELRGCPSCGEGIVVSALSTIRGLAIGGFSAGAGVNFNGNLSNGSALEGCFIGTDASGTQAVPNATGVSANGNPFAGAQPQNLRIGGSTPAQRNLISGNTGKGIDSNSTGLQVQGNLIGTNAAGSAALGNGDIGIFIAGCGNFSGFNAQIGGTSTAARNLVSGNASFGIQIGQPNGGCGRTGGALIRGNFIGSDITGTQAIGNGFGSTRSNVFLRTGGTAGSPNVIGGSAAGDGNLIVGAANFGVEVPGEANSPVRGNRMRGNTGLGIDGGAAGRSPNDADDADNTFGAGSDGRLQNYPDISAFTPGAGVANLSYRVDSTAANSVYPLQVDFFRADGDEGFEYLGADSYLAGEAQTVKAISLPLPPGVVLAADDVIVATATDAEGNSSEFSFHPVQSLQILSVNPASVPAGVPYTVNVRVESAPAAPFKPNGVVRVSDGRGGGCVAALQPTATANRSEGSCEAITVGTAAGLTLSASYSTLDSAFATAGGGSLPAQTAPLTLTPGAESLQRAGGSHQYAAVGSAFATPLSVRVLGAGGVPVAGIPVRFSVPASGASATLSASEAVSDAQGFAQVSATAGPVVGRYVVTARVGALSTSFTLNNDSALGSRCTAVRSATIGFRDDFVGAAIDPALWLVDANDGSVAVADGEAALGAPAGTSFPYVTAVGTPLPASGDWSLRWVATYSASAPNPSCTLAASTGLPVDGAASGETRVAACQDSAAGYRLTLPTSPALAFSSQPPALVRRDIEVCLLGNQFEAWVDGTRVARRTRDASALPDSLWFGQFARATSGAWNPFRLDLVEVRELVAGFDADLTIVSDTPDPSAVGQPVTVTVALLPEPGAPAAPTGTVAVSASTGESCTVTLPATSCVLNFASTGPRAITAVYAGDEVFRGGKAVVTDHSVLAPATLRIDDVERVEGNAGTSAFVFSVSLDNALGTPVSVQYATADGSATAPTDYASTSGTLNFSGSTTLQVVTVDVAGDTAVEPTEEFVVNLSAASGAAIGDGQGIGRIVNDDAPPPPNLRISDASVQERADAQLATMSFTLTLDRAPDAAASVRVRTRNGTATAGLDYTAIDFVLEFQLDGPLVQQVEVPVGSDGVFEPSQNFFVDLLDASGLVIADAVGEGVIVDLIAQAVVNSTGDGDDGACAPSAGGCTLREALRQANATAGLTRVTFAIPGSGVQRIQPTSPLPAVSAERITINGYSQSGARANAAASGPLDGLLLIEIDGSLAGPADGLKLCGMGSVQGLAIHSFSGAGIRIGCGSAQISAPVLIIGNYIGTDASGLVAHGNGSGIVADVRNPLGPGFNSSLEIGGFSPSARNLIAASTSQSVGSGDGALVRLLAPGVVVRVIGNVVGVDAALAAAAGNAGWGLRVVQPRSDCSALVEVGGNTVGGNRLGGLLLGAGAAANACSDRAPTRIRGNRFGLPNGLGNLGPGVQIGEAASPVAAGSVVVGATSFGGGSPAPGERNVFDSNLGAPVVALGTGTLAFVEDNDYGVSTQALDNGGDGPTPNDPGDGDSGPNGLLNAPVPLSAAYDDRLRRVSVQLSSDAAGGGFLGIDNRHVLVLANPDEPLRVIGGGSVRDVPQTLNLPISGSGLAPGDVLRMLTVNPTGSSELSAQSVVLSGIQAQVGDARRREVLAGSMTFTVTLSPPPVNPKQVSFRTRAATATPGSDYTETSGSLTLTAAAPSGTFSVPILNDSVVEEDETFIVEVAGVDDSGVGSDLATATIEDDDRLRRNENDTQPVELARLDGRNGFALTLPRAAHYSLAGLPDFDGNGRPDLAIGVLPSAPAATTGNQDAGFAYLLTGLAPPFAASIAIPENGAGGFARIDGVTVSGRGDQLGRALAALDLRGDGRSDLALGSPGFGNNIGRTAIVHGRVAALPARSTLDSLLVAPLGEAVEGRATAPAIRRAGWDVANLGDIDGDGRADLALTAPGELATGLVAVVFGRSDTAALPANVGGLVLPHGFRVNLAAEISRGFGGAVGAVGDFDGDGIGDFAVRSSGGDDDPVRIVYGRPRAGWSNVNPIGTGGGVDTRIRDSAGPVDAKLAGGGDFDGDGRSDLVFQVRSEGRSTLWLVRGRSGRPAEISLPPGGGASEIRIDLPWLGDDTPAEVAVVPDFNGDGRADVAIGLAGADVLGPRAGSVHLVYGRPTPPPVIDLFTDTRTKRLEGPEGSGAGQSLAALPDIQGDGLADLAIGAPGGGRVYVVFSNDHMFADNAEAQPAPAAAGARVLELGRAPTGSIRVPEDVEAGELLRMGDLNGDGRADVLAGSACLADVAAGQASPCVYDLVFGRTSPGGLRPFTASGSNGLSVAGTLATGLPGAGDFDGDGRDDLLLLQDGALQVYYGRNGAWPAVIDPTRSATRTQLAYPDFAAGVRNRILRAAFVGDINGDAREDLALVSCTTSACSQQGLRVVFGRTDRPASLNPNTASGASWAASGVSSIFLWPHSAVGNVGGGSEGDFVVGLSDGRQVVVFGNSPIPNGLDLGTLSGSNGFAITGLQGAASRQKVFGVGRFGTSLTRDTLAIVEQRARRPGTTQVVGRVSLLLGRATQPAIDLSAWTATQGPRVFGTISRPLTGLNQRAAVGGDFDLDGLADLALRLPDVEAHAPGSGLTQVIYGVAALTARDYELGEFDAAGGSLLIRGERAISASVAPGRTQVDALEWNGDGRVDLVIDDQIVDGAGLGRSP